MEEYEDHAFSAIYESVESGSDGDEYITISHPRRPHQYVRPEPTVPAPPPPTGEPSNKSHPQDILFQRAPHKPEKVQTPPRPPRMMHPSPVPVPRKGLPKPPLSSKMSTKKVLKYKKLQEEPSRTPKKLPEIPVQLSNKNMPQLQDYYETPIESGVTSIDNEEENEYDSIKETRRMIAQRKKYKHKAMRDEREMPTEIQAPPQAEEIQLDTISKKHDSISTRASYEMDDYRLRSESSKIVCLLLSITLVSLVIALIGLTLSLYGVVATHQMKYSVKFIRDNNSTTDCHDNDTMIEMIEGTSKICICGNSNQVCYNLTTKRTLL